MSCLAPQIVNQSWQQLDGSILAFGNGKGGLLKFRLSVRIWKAKDFPDTERGVVVDARQAGLNVSKAAHLLGL